MTVEVTPMSKQDWEDLRQLEQTIEDNLVSWLQVGFALMTIRDRQLYRTTHPTFEAYARERFDCARATAYQYIEGARSIENIRSGDRTFEVLPDKEALVRPLTRLDPEEQPKAWSLALERARERGDEKIMARHVVWAVDSLRGGVGGETTRSRISDATGELPPEFQGAFSQLTEIIYTAKRKRWEGVDRKKMIDILDRLRRMIEG